MKQKNILFILGESTVAPIVVTELERATEELEVLTQPLGIGFFSFRTFLTINACQRLFVNETKIKSTI